MTLKKYLIKTVWTQEACILNLKPPFSTVFFQRQGGLVGNYTVASSDLDNYYAGIHPQWNAVNKGRFETAMRAWEKASGNRVKFVQHNTGSVWQGFTNMIGSNPVVWYRLTKLDGLRGKATTGQAYVDGYVNIDTSLDNMTDPQTYLHELGHTLGLYHEHQRHDRNNSVMVTKSGSDWDIIPDRMFVLGFIKVKILFITIPLPYLYWGPFGVAVGGYDFNSIMGYTTDRNGNIYKRIPGGTVDFKKPGTISAGDEATIKRLY
jgi:hypothetical protein